jgi:hypothetical protein
MPKTKKKRGSANKPSTKGGEVEDRDQEIKITSKDTEKSSLDLKALDTPDGQEKPEEGLIEDRTTDLLSDINTDPELDFNRPKKSKGLKGLKGSKGSNGSNGSNGYNGSNGFNGFNGSKGSIGTIESELRTELESELKRLQEEFKRQKQITEELERKRDQVQLEGPEAIAEISKDISGQTEGTDLDLEVYPRILDTSVDQSIRSDFEIDIRFFKSIENLKTDMVNLQEQIESKLDSSALDELRTEQVALDEIADKINKFEREFSRMEKVLKKTDEKLDAVLMDLGFEESLNINKVPNYILVLVYETILNDVINRIKLVLGAQDTEEAVNKILEDVRSHTSGGELFKYEHNKISIPELKQYLDNKMISPRQIHLTFNSIMNRLIEYVPGYTPKNFKAMIKIMSQEYAVDTTAKLEDRFNTLIEDLNDIKGNINKFMLGYKDKVVNQQFYEKEMKMVNMHIGKLVDRIDELPNTIEKNLNDIIGKKIEEKFSELDLGNISNLVGQTGEPKLTENDKTDDKEEPKSIFSSGVIELGEDTNTSFEEEEYKDKDKDKDVSAGEVETKDEVDEKNKEVEMELGEEIVSDENNNIEASKENKEEIPTQPTEPKKSESEYDLETKLELKPELQAEDKGEIKNNNTDKAITDEKALKKSVKSRNKSKAKKEYENS